MDAPLAGDSCAVSVVGGLNRCGSSGGAFMEWCRGGGGTRRVRGSSGDCAGDWPVVLLAGNGGGVLHELDAVDWMLARDDWREAGVPLLGRGGGGGGGRCVVGFSAGLTTLV